VINTFGRLQSGDAAGNGSTRVLLARRAITLE
jgi:hypothetical protein